MALAGGPPRNGPLYMPPRAPTNWPGWDASKAPIVATMENGNNHRQGVIRKSRRDRAPASGRQALLSTQTGRPLRRKTGVGALGPASRETAPWGRPGASYYAFSPGPMRASARFSHCAPPQKGGLEGNISNMGGEHNPCYVNPVASSGCGVVKCFFLHQKPRWAAEPALARHPSAVP